MLLKSGFILEKWGELNSDLGINPDQLKKVASTLQISTHELLFDEADPYDNKTDEILKELFSGDVRVTLHRIERKRSK